MLTKLLFTYLVASFLIMLTLTASTPPTWTGTNLIQAGTMTIVQATTHQGGSNIYTYNYSPSFSVTPFTAVGIVSLETTDLNSETLKYLVNIYDYTSTSRLNANMNYPYDTNWRTFKVSYIAIDAAFTMVKVDYFSVNNPANVNTGTGERSYSGTFNLTIGSVDTTHDISIIPFLVGIDCHSTSGEHDVSWSTKLKTASSITYDLTVKQTTRVFQLTSYILVVDRTAIAFDMEQYLD